MTRLGTDQVAILEDPNGLLPSHYASAGTGVETAGAVAAVRRLREAQSVQLTDSAGCTEQLLSYGAKYLLVCKLFRWR